jgi:DNA mismatch repair protein MutS
MSTGSPYLSLLWPHGRITNDISDSTWTDLGVDRIVQALSLDPKRADAVEAIVRRLPTDKATIAYRLDITRELLASTLLGGAFLDLVPLVERLRYYTFRPDIRDWTPLQEVIYRIRELEHYVEVLGLLGGAFDAMESELQSEGLRQLRKMISQSRLAPLFIRLQTELPSLLKSVSGLKSIAIGINLGGGLEPVAATVLEIGDTPYRGSGLAGRLLGDSEHTGIAKLHTMDAAEAANPLLVPLFRDLSDLMQKAARPLAAALSEFAGLTTRNLVAIGDEILFYAGAVSLARKLREEELPVVVPSPAEPSGSLGAVNAQQIYNIDLALRRITDRHRANRDDGREPSRVVSSDVELDGAGQVAIVTGPNSGGKTTFLQAVGLAQILAQLGLFAPATRFTLVPVDRICTHYPALEKPQDEAGRFAEEADRLKEMLLGVTDRTLVLLNETLSSTAMSEASYIAADVVDLLLEIGCRVIYVTHLHDLARIGRERVASLAAGMETRLGELVPTFEIQTGEPQGKSYAAALAARHGLESSALRDARRRTDPADQGE